MERAKSDEECAAIWNAFRQSFSQALFVMEYWEGRRGYARRLIFRLGIKRFGSPTDHQRATLDTILNLDQLEALAEKLLDATTWDELLAE